MTAIKFIHTGTHRVSNANACWHVLTELVAAWYGWGMDALAEARKLVARHAALARWAKMTPEEKAASGKRGAKARWLGHVKKVGKRSKADAD